MRDVHSALKHEFAALVETERFLLAVAKGVVHFSEQRFVLLQNFVHFYVVALEATEILTIHFATVRKDIFLQSFYKGLGCSLHDLGIFVACIPQAHNYFQELVSIKIALRIIDEPMQSHIGCD